MSIHFTDDHEWIAIEGDVATVGFTDYGQSLLGDLVLVQLPHVGKEIEIGEEAALVKSVKAASNILSPLSGTIVEVNASVSDNPAVIASDPMGAGWLFKLSLSEPLEISTLLSERSYETSLI
jgi:glycine cleavage system H protein